MSHTTIAATVAMETTRRRFYEPGPEAPARAGRRRAARALQALAVRLDPSLRARPQLGH